MGDDCVHASRGVARENDRGSNLQMPVQKMKTPLAGRCVLVGALAAVMLASTGAAQGGDTSRDRPAVWIVTLGGYATVAPSFEGSDSYDAGFRPIIGFRRAGARDWLALPGDGIDIELIETDRFRAGPVAAVRTNRDTSREHRGFERIGGRDGIDIGVEAGVFAEYWPLETLRTRVELRETVVGAGGFVADLSADVVWRPGPWTLALGPRLTIADDRYLAERYGVSAAEAVGGLPVHETSAGIASVGAAAMVAYAWNERWTSRAFIEYDRLVGDAGSSPLIDSPDQIRAGIGTSVTFEVRR